MKNNYGKKRVTRKKTTKSTRKKSTRKSTTPKSSINILAAKKLLRSNYSQMVKGKMRAPSFITTLKSVNGKGGAEKIANLRRVLSSCKKMGIPLLKANGSGFKSYRTLVASCKVTFSRPTGTSVLGEKRGKEAINKADTLLNRKLREWKQKKASPAKKNGLLLLDNKPSRMIEYPDNDQFYDAPRYGEEELGQLYDEALRTPLPEFGRRLTNLHFGQRRVTRRRY